MDSSQLEAATPRRPSAKPVSLEADWHTAKAYETAKAAHPPLVQRASAGLDLDRRGHGDISTRQRLATRPSAGNGHALTWTSNKCFVHIRRRGGPRRAPEPRRRSNGWTKHWVEHATQASARVWRPRLPRRPHWPTGGAAMRRSWTRHAISAAAAIPRRVHRPRQSKPRFDGRQPVVSRRL